MNNERYNQIIDEAYGNYTTYMNNNWMETRWNKTWISDDGKSMSGRRYTKEEFIEKCKTDSEFSERWGLKIKERKLSLEERKKLVGNKTLLLLGSREDSYNEANIPTKLLIVIYNNEVIEVYE